MAKVSTRFFGLLVAMQLLIPLYSSAQKARFEFFSRVDGLAGNNTASVTQDDQGFLWFVNEGKIHRYDGRNFLVYPPPGELAARQELFLGLASWQDSLLFAWSEHYASLFDPKTGNWQRVEVKNESNKNEEVHFFQRLEQDEILISSLRKGFAEADIWHLQNNQLEQVLFPKYLGAVRPAFSWCSRDASGRTFLALRDTLFQLDRSGNILAFTPLGNICVECQNLCFKFGADGSLVLLANWRFYVFNRARNRFLPHPANRFLQDGRNPLHRFLLEENGSIWACGEDRNLIYYDALTDTLFNFNEELKELLPNQNDFKGLFQDQTGIIWIDTRLGLLKVSPQIYPFDRYFDGLNPSNAYYSFRGFAEDPAGMIYGMFYGGIAKLDPFQKRPLRLYTFDAFLNFYDLHAEGEDIWVNGRQLLDTEAGQLKNLPDSLHEMPLGDNGFFARDKTGRLWWASHYFLFYLEKSENGFQLIKELELPGKDFNRVEALHLGIHSGKLWVSLKGKLLRYDPETKEQRWFDLADRGLPVSHIMAIEEDREGKLWLGTDAGLVRFHPAGGAVSRYTVNDGLPDNFICGMLTEGDSCLWLSTNHGLSRFHISGGNFINFLKEDGLTHNEFNRKSYFKTRDGRMFFGGMQGVNAFFPEEVMRAYRNTKKSARIVLTSFEYIDERSDSTIRKTQFGAMPEIHFRHWEWSYYFEFALTDYFNPEEVFYSYKMEGYRDNWSAPSKFHFARFNGLPPGKYVFRVKARDSHGLWRPNELAVKLVVHPPWWATWWAYGLYGFLLLSTIYFIRRYELNRQRLKLKTRLYTNLTHEFRTPLAVILGMAAQIRTDPEKHLDQGLPLIESNGRSMLRLISQLLDLAKLESRSFHLQLQQGDIVPFLRYVVESFQSYAGSKDLSLRFFTSQDSLEMDYDPEQTKHVLTNLISNAVKFTPPGGEVAVRLSEEEGTLNLEVEDTGIGIRSDDLPHIFDRFFQAESLATREGEGSGVGLAHALELVKLMGGDISVKSEPGKGSSFLVRLPVRRKAGKKEERPEQKSILHQAPGNSLEPDSPAPDGSGLPQLLIIEDNPDGVVYLKSCLAGLYQLDVAYNGRIGVEKALNQIPDLIISDVMMPEMDGFEVSDTLKNDERTSHIPIILLTAMADAASRIAGLRRGADAYLSKPFDKEELLAHLEMLAGRQKRMAAYFSRVLQGNGGPPLPDPGTREAIRIEDAFVQKVRNIIEEHYADENFSLTRLCQEIGMSRSQLFRKMQALIRTSPSDFIRSYRLNRAKTIMETTDLTVSEVAWKVGFKDPAHFSRSFQEEFGFPPSETRK